MDLLGQLYLRAQFLFLLKLFGIFGNLILVPSSHLLTSQNHYTISSTKRSSMSGGVQNSNCTLYWWWV